MEKAKKLKQRDDYELENLGGYKLIFPTKRFTEEELNQVLSQDEVNE